MKRILKLIAISVIVLMTFFVLVKPVKANSVLSDLGDYIEQSQERERQAQQAWEDQYLDKMTFLENSMYVVAFIIVFNIILFSILINKSKNSKIDLIYKILQIILLVLIFVLYKIWNEIPGMPGGVAPAVVLLWEDQLRPAIMMNFTIIISINLLLSIFIKKKSYLFSSTILILLILIFFAILAGGGISLLPIIVLIILTNIIFLPLYLNKNKLKEEGNVRI